MTAVTSKIHTFFTLFILLLLGMTNGSSTSHPLADSLSQIKNPPGLKALTHAGNKLSSPQSCGPGLRVRRAAGATGFFPPCPVGMAATVGCAPLKDEQGSSDQSAATWVPGRECFLKNIANVAESGAQDGEFPDISHCEDDVSGFAVESMPSWSDLEESEDEASNVSEAAAFPELQTAASYEVEDWDKELEDSELNPYDAGDLPCGSFEENNPLALYSWQEDSVFYPGCYHAASITFTPPVRIVETGQFDDAEE